MVAALFGKKLGMTQYYDENRRLLPVTIIQAGPCGVTSVKTQSKHGYDAVQIGFDEVQEKKLSKAEIGHLRSGNSKFWKYLKEFRGEANCQVGDIFNSDVFQAGDLVDVQGSSKGKGFQGVMKRHNFGGGPATHGSMFHRAPGSIGCSSYPSRVLKNKKLPGQMGNKTVTVKGLTIVNVRSEDNILLVLGAVPGSKGSVVVIQKAKGSS
jgi:large subunit ribosomal protein L3